MDLDEVLLRRCHMESNFCMCVGTTGTNVRYNLDSCVTWEWYWITFHQCLHSLGVPQPLTKEDKCSDVVIAPSLQQAPPPTHARQFWTGTHWNNWKNADCWIPRLTIVLKSFLSTHFTQFCLGPVSLSDHSVIFIPQWHFSSFHHGFCQLWWVLQDVNSSTTAPLHHCPFHSISEIKVCVCPSSLRRWSLFLLVGLTDPYNHTYSESLWWKLFKNNNRTQRQKQWQRQRQRQRHRQSA